MLRWRLLRKRYKMTRRLFAASATLGALILAAGCGCSLFRGAPLPAPADLAPTVVVVSADRYQYFYTNTAGIPGWFVPVAVHAEYCEAVALVNYYRSQNKPPKGSDK